MTPYDVDPVEAQAWNEAALGGSVPLPAIRIMIHPRPVVVLGRAQRADEALLARAQAAGIEVCERASGGGAVLAGPWLLGASVVVPPGHPLAPASIPASYRWIGELHADLVGQAGLDAVIPAHPVDPGDLRWACYAGLSHGEVVVAGRKILGLSQARRRAGVLFSSGLLVGDTPWELLCDVMDKPRSAAAELAARTTSLGLVGPVAELAADLLARLRAAIEL